MVRTKGPLLSTAASGSIASTLTASTWKGRSYLKKLSIPTNNQQAQHLGIRAAMTTLSKRWKHIGAPAQATWEELAARDLISPFDAYMRDNLLRAADSTGFTKDHPAAETPLDSELEIIDDVTANRFVVLELDDGGTDIPWIGLLYRSLSTGFSPSRANLVQCFYAVDDYPTYFIEDRPPTHTTWYYRAAASSDDGTLVLGLSQWQVVF